MSSSLRRPYALPAAIALAAAALAIPSTASAGLLSASQCVESAQPMLDVVRTPSPGSNPGAAVLGPDGNVWFTEQGSNSIGRVTAMGAITEFPMPAAGVNPFDITVGSDGNLWFTSFGASKVGRITTAGAVTLYDLPWSTATDPVNAMAIAGDLQGGLWFTQDSGFIGKVTTAGEFSQVPIGAPGATGEDISFANGGMAITLTGSNEYGIAMLNVSNGSMLAYKAPPGSGPATITGANDGTFWFTDRRQNAIWRAAAKPTGGFDYTAYPTPSTSSQAIGWVTGGSSPWLGRFIADPPMWFMGSGGQVGQVTERGVINTYPATGTLPFSGAAYGGSDGPQAPLAFGSDGNLWITEPACDSMAMYAGVTAGPMGMWITSAPAAVTRGRTYAIKVKATNAGTAKIAISTPTVRSTIKTASVKRGVTTLRVTVPTSLTKKLNGRVALILNASIKGMVQSGQSSPLTVRK